MKLPTAMLSKVWTRLEEPVGVLWGACDRAWNLHNMGPSADEFIHMMKVVSPEKVTSKRDVVDHLKTLRSMSLALKDDYMAKAAPALEAIKKMKRVMSSRRNKPVICEAGSRNPA